MSGHQATGRFFSGNSVAGLPIQTRTRHRPHPSSRADLLKRQAAIIGATPPLLRWTIARPCELKDEAACRKPDAAFRQLRNLRTLSVARVDHRIVDGFALMPPDGEADSKIVRGFPVDEILDLCGGSERVTDACGSCPANVSLDRPTDDDQGWAGCFGWLPFHDDDDGMASGSSLPAGSGSFEFMQLLGEHDAATNGEIVTYQSFDRIASSFGEIPVSGIATPRRQRGRALPSYSPWFSLWSAGHLNRDRLEFTNPVFKKLLEESDRTLVGVSRLANAISRCVDHRLEMRTELIPAGHSDGVWWQTLPQCQRCGATRAAKSIADPCPVCGSRVEPIPSRKHRVLGNRPYLNLAGVIGEDAAQSLQARQRE